MRAKWGDDPDNPPTIPGRKSRTITIDCDDEAGDKIISYVRHLSESE